MQKETIRMSHAGWGPSLARALVQPRWATAFMPSRFVSVAHQRSWVLHVRSELRTYAPRHCDGCQAARLVEREVLERAVAARARAFVHLAAARAHAQHRRGSRLGGGGAYDTQAPYANSKQTCGWAGSRAAGHASTAQSLGLLGFRD